MPIGGFVYYIIPPQSYSAFLKDPYQAIAYAIFVMSSCAFFSRKWIDISGSSSKDVARQLMDQELLIEGQVGKSMIAHLDNYIPIAASFGGVCIGAL